MGDILVDFPDELIGQTIKDQYPFVCVGCGATLQSAPSVLMLMGFNTGMGVCDCGQVNHIRLAADNERMIAEDWDEIVPETEETE